MLVLKHVETRCFPNNKVEFQPLTYYRTEKTYLGFPVFG